MSVTIVFEEDVTVELFPDLSDLCVEGPYCYWDCRPADRTSSSSSGTSGGRAFGCSANHKQQLAHQAVVQASHGQDQQEPQGNDFDFALHTSFSSSHLANALTPEVTLLFHAQSPDLSGKHARRCCRGHGPWPRTAGARRPSASVLV